MARNFQLILLASCLFSSSAIASDSTAVPKGTIAPHYVPVNWNTAVQFAGVFSTGGCIPAPTCPAGYTAMVTVSSQSAQAVSSVSNCHSSYGNSCDTVATQPMYSFRTYATGDDNGNAVANPPGCNNPYYSGGGNAASCGGTSDPSGTAYWRACIVVTDQAGKITPQYGQQAQLMGEIVAYTRCELNSGDTPAGSTLDDTSNGY
jgi:hypothetical protein